MLLNRKAFALLASGLLVLSAAACSSNSSGGKSGGATQPASSSGSSATGKPIKIGMIAPVNAPITSDNHWVAAVRAAMATVNSQGGVKGRPLQLDFCNEANDANKGAACARDIAASDDVATIGVVSPFAGTAVTQVLSAAGMANVGYLTLQPQEYAATNNFPSNSGGVFFQSASVVGALKNDSSLKKVAIVANEGPQSQPIVNAIKKATVNAGGTVATTVLLPLTTIADYTPYAAKIIKSGAQVTSLALAGSTAAGIITAVHQLGGNVVFASSASIIPVIAAKQLGSQANGMYLGSPTPWINDATTYPGFKDFVASMKSAQDHGDSDADIAKSDPFAALDWLNVLQLRDVLTNIVDSGQQITRASILAAFSSAKNLKTYNLVKSPWSPSVKQTVLPGFQNASITEVYLLKLQDGNLSLASNDPIEMSQYLK